MRLIITVGDCNGIGIEVMLKAIIAFDAEFENPFDYEIAISSNYETLKEYTENFSTILNFEKDGFYINNRFCKILNCPTKHKIEFGKVSQSAGKLSAEAIEFAIEKMIKGEYDCIVTMPVSKEALYKANWQYPGHTEMLADRCNVQKPLMILCTSSIRVALVTIHIPLKEVQGSITIDNLLNISRIFCKSLKQDFGINEPKIAMLGLNPHAGEKGSIGTEETEILVPAIELCQKEKISFEGPFPADGFFAHGEYKQYDGILAMYHDQGLIPLKLLAQGKGVNFTAGLPIIRTSPDHGTGFSIAGKGIADESSALEAIKMAIDIVNNRKKYKI